MEAFKNTSMMIILAGIFYGAYQMFVSEPPNWKKNQTDPNGLVLDATDPSLSSVNPAANGAAANSIAMPSNPSANLSGMSQFDPGTSASGGMSLPSASLPSAQIQSQPQTPSWPPSLPTQPTNPAIAHGAGSAELPARPTANPPGNLFGSSSLSQGLPNPSLPATSQNPEQSFSNPAANTGIGYDSRHTSVQPAGHHQPAESMDTRPRMELPEAGMTRPLGLLPIQPAVGTVESAAPPTPQLTLQLKAAMEAAGVDIQNGDWAKALQTLSGWYRLPLNPEDREHLVGWLDRLAGEVVYSRKHQLTSAHQVNPGETLTFIAARYQMPVRLLARINQFPASVSDTEPLQPGTELKVVPGPFEAEATLESGHLTLFANGLYAGRFSFQTGDSVPDQSLIEPISFVSLNGIPAQDEQRRHEPLAPTNPFGRYCLVVGQTAVLHSPGGNPKGSCLQFSEQDMEDLLILLPPGTTVRIIR